MGTDVECWDRVDCGRRDVPGKVPRWALLATAITTSIIIIIIIIMFAIIIIIVITIATIVIVRGGDSETRVGVQQWWQVVVTRV